MEQLQGHSAEQLLNLSISLSTYLPTYLPIYLSIYPSIDFSFVAALIHPSVFARLVFYDVLETVGRCLRVRRFANVARDSCFTSQFEPSLREARILRVREASGKQLILTRKIRVSRAPCFTSQNKQSEGQCCARPVFYDVLEGEGTQRAPPSCHK